MYIVIQRQPSGAHAALHDHTLTRTVYIYFLNKYAECLHQIHFTDVFELTLLPLFTSKQAVYCFVY